VRVQASSVNPVDNAIAAGMLKGMFEHDFPVVLGRDFAGVVEQAGPGATLAVGADVFGFVLHADPSVGRGAWAERITVAEAGVASRPSGVDLAAAGTTPLAGVTALSAVDAVSLKTGESVLIVGATGGVGSFAVQMAVLAGAKVIAPGLPEDEEYLRGLGVAAVVARDGDVAAACGRCEPTASTPSSTSSPTRPTRSRPTAPHSSPTDARAHPSARSSPVPAASRSWPSPTRWRSTGSARC